MAFLSSAIRTNFEKIYRIWIGLYKIRGGKVSKSCVGLREGREWVVCLKTMKSSWGEREEVTRISQSINGFTSRHNSTRTWQQHDSNPSMWGVPWRAFKTFSFGSQCNFGIIRSWPWLCYTRCLDWAWNGQRDRSQFSLNDTFLQIWAIVSF